MAVGMGAVGDLLCARGCEAVVNTRAANIQVFYEGGVDVVPPFLVAEVAGSLSIDEDREQLRRFAESILDWLARTRKDGGATIHRLR
jgi:hypothetical protein